MKKLLFLGGGYADVPLIKSAQELGYYVITTGNEPTQTGHQYSDEYVYGDFSDKEQMLDIAREKEVEGVCSCCNDFSAISAAYVAEKMGFPGHDSYQTTLTIHHKDKFRKFAQNFKIPSPYAESFTKIESATRVIDKLDFPLIIKPVDLTGGKGISVIYQKSDARLALERAFSISKAKRVVIEEFISGTRHGLSMLIDAGKVVFSFLDDEHYYKNPHMVFGTTYPGSVNSTVIEQLHRNSEIITNLLKLKAGIFHMQFILKDHQPYIIEICRRAPGDLYTKFVEHSTGIDYSRYIVSAQVSSKQLKKIKTSYESVFTARFCIMAPHNGVVITVIVSEELNKYIIDREEWWNKGERITDFMSAKLGILFLQFPSLEDMKRTISALESHVRVIVS